MSAAHKVSIEVDLRDPIDLVELLNTERRLNTIAVESRARVQHFKLILLVCRVPGPGHAPAHFDRDRAARYTRVFQLLGTSLSFFVQHTRDKFAQWNF